MSTSVELSPEVFGKLAQGYELRDPERVRAWLTEYPFLVPILLDLRPEIRHHFPYSAVTLEVVEDPEEDHTELVGWIGFEDNDDYRGQNEREFAISELLWNGTSYITQDKLSFLLG